MLWLPVTANAVAGGILIGWAVENVGLESLGLGMWVRSLALVAAAVASPVVASAAIMARSPMPPLSSVLSLERLRRSDRLAAALGLIVAATLVLSLQVALGLVFDPRYKDFPFAPLTAAIVPLAVHGLAIGRGPGRRGMRPKRRRAVLLAVSAIYIVPNEGVANWQSLWLCAAFAALALTLFRGAARQAEHEQRGRDGGQPDIIEHDAEAGQRQRHCEHHQSRPQKIDRGDDQRRIAEHRALEQRDGDAARRAQPRVETGGASQPDLRILDTEIAQIERIAESAETDDQKPVGGAGTGQKKRHATDYAAPNSARQCRVVRRQPPFSAGRRRPD